MPDSKALIPSATTLADYQKQRGFQVWQQTSQQGDGGAQSILDAVRQAKLRGRGGAGMATASKWQVVRNSVAQRGGPAFLVCNAYDADPQSLVAATLLAQQPFMVLEGMLLAAQAVGAREAYLYMHSTNRAGYAAISAALNEMHGTSLLGNMTVNVVGVDLGFMGGEESTMLEAIKGHRPMAQQRPPYPAQVGLGELPTAIANLETLVQVVSIMRDPAAYAKTGTNTTPGTKYVTVYGATPVGSEGGAGTLLEVPFGTSIAAILKQAGITVGTDSARGVAVGGPEGGVLPLTQLTTAFDYEALAQVGTIVGSGTIEVLGAQTCMVDWARERTQYLTDQSCGKCIPCRTGTKRIAGTLAGIMSDVGVAGDLDLLNEFADYVPDGSLCGFGWNATHPLRTALRYYPDDFTQHLQGTCPTGTCIPVRSHRFATKGVL
jgi:NADH:ubiquinone oxidoreductase subunit F (NADH-binding)